MTASVPASGVPRLVSLKPPIDISAVGAASADRGIVEWAAASWTGVPWVWSERASVAAEPSALAIPNVVSAVMTPNDSRPCLWSSRAKLVETPTTGASPTAWVVTVPAGVAPAAALAAIHWAPSHQYRVLSDVLPYNWNLTGEPGAPARL